MGAGTRARLRVDPCPDQLNEPELSLAPSVPKHFSPLFQIPKNSLELSLHISQVISLITHDRTFAYRHQ